MWNLSIPAILKAYIDDITVTGITFKYSEKGAVGLLEGKRMVNISARGGNYSSEPSIMYEMGEDVEAIVGNTVKKAQDLAKSFK